MGDTDEWMIVDPHTGVEVLPGTLRLHEDGDEWSIVAIATVPGEPFKWGSVRAIRPYPLDIAGRVVRAVEERRIDPGEFDLRIRPREPQGPITVESGPQESLSDLLGFIAGQLDDSVDNVHADMRAEGTLRSVEVPPGLDGIRALVAGVMERLYEPIAQEFGRAMAAVYVLGYSEAEAGQPMAVPGFAERIPAWEDGQPEG